MQQITTEPHADPRVSPQNQTRESLNAQPAVVDKIDLQSSATTDRDQAHESRTGRLLDNVIAPDETAEGERELLLLQEAAAILVSLASRSDVLSTSPATDRALEAGRTGTQAVAPCAYAPILFERITDSRGSMC